MDAKTLFYVGALLGFTAGVVLTVIVARVRSLFASGVARRLRREIQCGKTTWTRGD